MAEKSDKGAKAPKGGAKAPAKTAKAEKPVEAKIAKGRGKPAASEAAAADVTFLVSLTASPTPMLSTILSSRGTCMAFL